MSDWRNFLDAYGRQSAYCPSSYHSEVFKLSLQFCSLFQNRSADVAQSGLAKVSTHVFCAGCAASGSKSFRRRTADGLSEPPAMKWRVKDPRKPDSLRHSYRETFNI